MVCVGNVLLLLVPGISILGLSMKVSAMLVKVVTKCLIRREILTITSGLSIRVRNRTTVLTVVKTLQRKLASSYTTGVSTRVRNRTTALTVVKTSQIGVILDDTATVSTRQSESTLTASSEKNKPTV